MWFDRWRNKKKRSHLQPPDGMDSASITTQSSVCTGETLIGFLEPHTGRLLQAVVVRNETDIAAFYRAYGYEPPCRS